MYVMTGHYVFLKLTSWSSVLCCLQLNQTLGLGKCFLSNHLRKSEFPMNNANLYWAMMCRHCSISLAYTSNQIDQFITSCFFKKKLFSVFVLWAIGGHLMQPTPKKFLCYYQNVNLKLIWWNWHFHGFAETKISATMIFL